MLSYCSCSKRRGSPPDFPFSALRSAFHDMYLNGRARNSHPFFGKYGPHRSFSMQLEVGLSGAEWFSLQLFLGCCANVLRLNRVSDPKHHEFANRCSGRPQHPLYSSFFILLSFTIPRHYGWLFHLSSRRSNVHSCEHFFHRKRLRSWHRLRHEVATPLSASTTHLKSSSWRAATTLLLFYSPHTLHTYLTPRSPPSQHGTQTRPRIPSTTISHHQSLNLYLRLHRYRDPYLLLLPSQTRQFQNTMDLPRGPRRHNSRPTLPDLNDLPSLPRLRAYSEHPRSPHLVRRPRITRMEHDRCAGARLQRCELGLT